MPFKEVKGKCVIFSAPSGAGKTTIVRHLLDNDLGLEFSISATTRTARVVEREGKDYHYMSVKEFKSHINKGSFLEWEEVYAGQYYGTLASEIKRIWKEGKTVIFDVDVIGGLNLKSHFGDAALAVFVKAPNIEALRARLSGRKTENEESINRRMDKAAKEMEFAEAFDYVLVNDDLDDAKATALQVVKGFISD